MMARKPMSCASPPPVVCELRLAMLIVEPVATLSQRSAAPFTSVPQCIPAPVAVVLLLERRAAQRASVDATVEVLNTSGVLGFVGLSGEMRLPDTNPFM